MNSSALIVMVIFLAGCFYLIHEDAKAMEQCRKTHSEETCFYQLNH